MIRASRWSLTAGALTDRAGFGSLAGRSSASTSDTDDLSVDITPRNASRRFPMPTTNAESANSIA